MLLNKMFVWVEVLERGEMDVSVYVCEEGKEKSFFGWVLNGFDDKFLKEDFEDFFVCEKEGFFVYEESYDEEGNEIEGDKGFFEDIGRFVKDGVVYLSVDYYGGLSVYGGVVDGGWNFREVDNVVLEESEFEGIKVGFCKKFGIIKLEK